MLTNTVLTNSVGLVILIYKTCLLNSFTVFSIQCIGWIQGDGGAGERWPSKGRGTVAAGRGPSRGGVGTRSEQGGIASALKM